MNFIDLFVFVLLIWAVFKGFTRGLIIQIATLAAFVVGIYLAIKLSGYTAHILSRFIHSNEEYLYIFSLAVTFLLVFFGISFLGRVVEKLVEAAQLSFVNKILGVIFSVFKTVLIVGVLLAYAEKVNVHTPFLPASTVKNSIFFKPCSKLAKMIFPALRSESVENNEEFVLSSGVK